MWECVPDVGLDSLRPNGDYGYTFYGVYVVGKGSICSSRDEGGTAIACPTRLWGVVRWYVSKDACLPDESLIALSYGSLL